MTSLQGQVAIVTGASRGIGRPTAMLLGAQGATVVATARSGSDLEIVAAAIRQAGGSCLAVPGDAWVEADVRRTVQATLGQFGRVDILVNNAGIGILGLLVEMSASSSSTPWERGRSPVGTSPSMRPGPALSELVRLARAMAVPGTRHLLGVTGPPGAGKTTLALAIRAALGDAAAFVPMDGFHLSNEELVRMGLRDRKGAPATFDAAQAMSRSCAGSGTVRDLVVLAPEFDRIADAVPLDAISVPRGVPLVITEGNYLLLDDGPWAAIRSLLNAAWYVASDETRVERRSAATSRPARRRLMPASGSFAATRRTRA